MGMTGAGKTSFIKEITGLDMEVGHTLEACTKEIHVATITINGQVVRFIDTPGFDDTDMKDTDILRAIGTYLSGSNIENLRLAGILYLHRITDVRMGGTALKNLRMFKTLVGDHNMSNVILLTTMWSNLQPSENGEKRLDELIETHKFWGGMIASGATHERYHGTKADAYRIITPMLENAPVFLQLQEELANGTKLAETTAGKQVNESLELLQVRHAEEMAMLKKEITEASQAENGKLRQELQDRHEDLLEEQQKVVEAQKRLYEVEIEVLKGRVAELENKSSCIVC
ncbi:MAG: hypothetical protein MMC33_006510 [Icmadophila ericetorum]|nr:hypothetical protein [Icmadophila ericetorum]